MKINAEKKEGNVVALDIEVPAEEFTQNYNQAFRHYTKNIKIPGFRKGKVPPDLLKKYIDENRIKKDVIEYLISNSCNKAIVDKQLEAIVSPRIELLQAELGQPLQYRAYIEVKPDITLGEYKNLEVVVEADKFIDDEDVLKELNLLKYKYATLVPVEDRPIKMGDVVTMITEGFVDGEPIPLGKVDNLQVEVKEENLLPGYAEQIIGMNLNEEKDIPITLPDTYNWVDLRGKNAIFKTKILEIKEFQFPELNDEFAKTVGDFRTLEELKENIKNYLESVWEEKQQLKIHKAVLDKVVSNAQIEVPENMIEREMMAMWMNSDGRVLREQKIPKELLEKSWENWKKREDIRAEAIRRIKTTLVLGAIAKQEGITLTQSEVEEQIKAFAEDRKLSPEQLKAFLSQENRLVAFMDEILSLKIIDWVLNNNNVKLVDKEGNIIERDQTEKVASVIQDVAQELSNTLELQLSPEGNENNNNDDSNKETNG